MSAEPMGAADTGQGSTSTVLVDEAGLRATRWSIEPGGVIPMHRHEHPYVVVPLVTATMHVTDAHGTVRETALAIGEAYTRPAGTEHEVANRTSDAPIVFVEVERLG